MTTTTDGAEGGDDTGSLLDAANPPADTPPADGAPPATDTDPNAWLPEKFRVVGEDGKLDEAASARKLAESYAHLEKHKGAVSQAPETPEGYELKVEGLEGDALEAFKGDAMFQEFAKDMHGQGLSNEQLNAVVNRYLKAAPQLLAANEQLALADAQKELSALWPDKATMAEGATMALKAIDTFAAKADDVPGSRARVMDKYRTDPDFMALMASIGRGLGEDTPVGTQLPSSDMDIDALMKSEAYWKAEHPDHAKVNAKVSEHYARKHGTAKRR